jgi:hypothetical protein
MMAAGQAWLVPRMPLMARLLEVCKERVMRSDSLFVTNAPEGPAVKKLPKGFARGALWFDYNIPL